MRILVMGAGAVGSYLAAQLKAAGEDVAVCARGAHLAAIKAGGLEINGVGGHLRVELKATDDPREFKPYDLVVFSVKSYDTEQAARTLTGCLARDGVVLTVQNGIENEEKLGAILGAEHIMGGNARVGVEVVAPGRIEHRSNGFIEFGELDGRVTERARRLAEIFQRAGILGELTPRLLEERWFKLLGNAAFNPTTAITHRLIGEVMDDPDGFKLLRDLMDEVQAVARAEGVEITTERIDQYVEHAQEKLRDNNTSTAQDLVRGKRLEYEAITGAVVRRARKHAIAVPANETMYTLLKLLDKRASDT